MPEVNHVPFRYDPMDDSLYLDMFRSRFYTERLDDVEEALQFCAMAAAGCALEIKGELFFSEDEDQPPQIRGIRLGNAHDRSEYGNPYPETNVTLWPEG